MNQLPQRVWNPIPKSRPEAKKSKLTRGSSIKPVSAKRAKLNKIYSALRKKFLEDHPYCQFDIAERFGGLDQVSGMELMLRVSIPNWVTVPSCDIHHKRGRGKYLLDTTTWMAVSREAHDKIHADPKTAYAKGYMLQR